MLGRPIRVPDLHTGRWHVPQYLIWVQSVPNHMLSERGDFCRLIRRIRRTANQPHRSVCFFQPSMVSLRLQRASGRGPERCSEIANSDERQTELISRTQRGVRRRAQIRFAANPREPVDGYSGRLRRGLLDSPRQWTRKIQRINAMTKLPSQFIRCPMESTRRPCHTHPTICWRRLISPPPSDQVEHLGFGRHRTHSVAAPTGSPHAS